MSNDGEMSFEWRSEVLAVFEKKVFFKQCFLFLKKTFFFFKQNMFFFFSRKH